MIKKTCILDYRPYWRNPFALVRWYLNQYTWRVIRARFQALLHIRRLMPGSYRRRNAQAFLDVAMFSMADPDRLVRLYRSVHLS